jgi:hypothetical protein
MKEISFYGEFGYFNTKILEGMQNYLIQNPVEKIKVYTYHDYGKILDLLFPNIFIIESIELRKARAGYNSYDSNKDVIRCSDNIMDITVLLKDHITGPLELFEYYYGNNKFNYITKPIIYNPTDEIKEKYSKKNICLYFPRKRTAIFGMSFEESRNATIEDAVYIINTVKTTNMEIIIVGHDSETILIPDVEKITDLHISIYLMSICKVLISCDSGFIDFAKNCGCNKVIVTNCRALYHKFFAPFNNQTILVNNINEINKYL